MTPHTVRPEPVEGHSEVRAGFDELSPNGVGMICHEFWKHQKVEPRKSQTVQSVINFPLFNMAAMMSWLLAAGAKPKDATKSTLSNTMR